MAGAEHAGLVDDEHGAFGQPAVLPRRESAPSRSSSSRATVQDAIPAPDWSSAAAVAFTEQPRTGNPAALPGGVGDGEAAGFAGAGDAGDDVDQVAGCGRAGRPSVAVRGSARADCRVSATQRRDGDLGRGRSCGRWSRLAGPASFQPQQFPGGEHARSSNREISRRGCRRVERHGFGGAQDLFGQLLDERGGAPVGSRSQRARTTSRRWKMLVCAVSPSGPSSSSLQPLSCQSRRAQKLGQLVRGQGVGQRCSPLGHDVDSPRRDRARRGRVRAGRVAARVRSRARAPPAVHRSCNRHRVAGARLGGAGGQGRRSARRPSSIRRCARVLVRCRSRRRLNARSTGWGMPAISYRPLPRGRQLDPELPGELVAQHGAVEGAGGAGVPVERPGPDRPPVTVLGGDQVRHQHVGVQLRVAEAGGAMPERGPDQPGAGFLPSDRRGPAGRTRLPVSRYPNATVTACSCAWTAMSADRFGSEGVEQADAFGGGERQIPAGQPCPRRRPQRRPGRRVPAVEHGGQAISRVT